MNDDSILGNTLGQLGGVIKQTGKQVVKTTKDIVEGIPEQVSVKTEPASQDNKAMQSSSSSDKDTREIVEGMYSKSDDYAKKDDLDKTQTKGQPEFEKMMVSKTPEERKKLLQLHLERHKLVYADQLLHPTSRKQEERPAEEIEKEEKERKQMEALEFEEKKKKELPFTVKQGTHEKVPGISG